MANPWFRLWGDMINDPKWRTIARASKQKIGDVVAVYVHMMTCASNATERGRTDGWCDEDVATALDIDTEQVEAIRNAMQGRVLDGDYLTGWEKRQPLREDGAAERAKAWREEQKASKQTNPNATERNQTLDKIREEEIREEVKEKPTAKAEPKYSALDDLIAHGVDLQTASDWLAVRKAKKAPPTKTALVGVFRELTKYGMTVPSGIQLCCERGWAGFNPDWLTNTKVAPTGGTSQLGKAGQATAAAAQRLIERMESGQAN